MQDQHCFPVEGRSKSSSVWIVSRGEQCISYSLISRIYSFKTYSLHLSNRCIKNQCPNIYLQSLALFLLSNAVKSAIPTARSSLDRVRTKLSAVAHLLPRRIKAKTQEVKLRDLPAVEEDEEPKDGATTGDEFVITRVAAAQKLLNSTEIEKSQEDERSETFGSRRRKVGIMDSTEMQSASRQDTCSSAVMEEMKKLRKRNVEFTKNVVHSPELVSPPKNQKKSTTVKEFRLLMV